MCLAAPTVSPPSLGGGLSIVPPGLGAFSGDVDLCCKRLAFNIPLPPIPLPPLAVNGGTTTLFAAAFTTIQHFLDSLSIDCPLE